MKKLIVIAFGIFIAIPAKAFDYIGWGGAPMYDSGYFLNSSFNNLTYLNNTTLNNARSTTSDAQGNVLPTPASKKTKLTLAPSTKTLKWPKKLAKKFPRGQGMGEGI